MGFDQYKARIDLRGPTKRDASINHAKDAFYRYAVNSPEYESILLNGVETNALILDGDDYGIKYMCSTDGTSYHGGMIVIWNDRPWLVTEIHTREMLYSKATIQLCNYMLKFTNADGDIVEKPCIIKDVTKYLVGELDKDMMTIGSSRMSLTIAKDDDTKHLHRGSRFLVDDKESDECIAYEITKPDRVTGTLEYGGVREGVYKYLIRETNSLDSDDTESMVPDNDPYVPGEPDEPHVIKENVLDGGWF